MKTTLAIIGSVLLLALSTSAAQTNSIAASVRLAWDANTEPDIADYYIHRGEQSGQRIETRKVGLWTTFEWFGLVAGSTNFFTVSVKNTSGLESDPSNEVAFRVVSAPGRPLMAIAEAVVVQTTVWQTVTNTYKLLP